MMSDDMMERGAIYGLEIHTLPRGEAWPGEAVELSSPAPTFTGRLTATLWDGLQHRGYRGTVEVIDGSDMLHGKVAGIRSLITYEAYTLSGLRAQFIKAVNGYLADCAADGKEPDKPIGD